MSILRRILITLLFAFVLSAPFFSVGCVVRTGPGYHRWWWRR